MTATSWSSNRTPTAAIPCRARPTSTRTPARGGEASQGGTGRRGAQVTDHSQRHAQNQNRVEAAMPGRSLKASSARPSQTQAEGRADDASSLTSNTVAHFGGVFRGQASNYRERLRFRSAGGAFWLSEFLHEMTLSRVRSMTTKSIPLPKHLHGLTRSRRSRE